MRVWTPILVLIILLSYFDSYILNVCTFASKCVLHAFNYKLLLQVAELVRTTIEGHTAPVPAILEIPSKDHPYDPTKDSILRRAKGMFNPEDMR